MERFRDFQLNVSRKISTAIFGAETNSKAANFMFFTKIVKVNLKQKNDAFIPKGVLTEKFITRIKIEQKFDFQIKKSKVSIELNL